MINKVIIAGRLVRDPELRYTSGQQIPCALFTLASERDYKQQGGPDADFIRCIAWRDTAEFISKYFKKGKPALVAGRLQTRQYNADDGKAHTVTEVIVENVWFFEARSDEPQQQGGGRQSQSGQRGSQQAQRRPTANNVPAGFVEVDDDGLPF